MAVYTEPGDDELREFLDEYAIGAPVSCKGIAEGVENSNFLLVTEQSPFILTLYEKRVDPAELPFFLTLLHHLAAKGVVCPVPVAGRDGQALRQLAGRPAAIVTFLTGMWPRRVTVDHCRELGAALARLHIAGADFQHSRRNRLALDGWYDLAEACGDAADRCEAGLAQSIRDALERLQVAWPSDLPSGVIHADLFPDNVFFQNGKLSGLIDFYFACTDALAYDLAICINAWCFESDGAFNVTKARALTGAYAAIRPLTQREFACLPLLSQGAALRFLLTRLYDWLNRSDGALVRVKDPLEYARKLRFHAAVTDAGAYGLDAPV